MTLWSLLNRRSTLSVIDQVVVSAANFLTGVIVARWCSKEVFGLYVLGFSIVLLAQSLQQSAISVPYTVHSPRLEGRRLAEYTGSTLVHQAIAAAVILAVLGMAWLVMQVSGVGPQGLAPVILTLSAVTYLVMFREFIRQVWFARMLMGTVLLVDSAVAAMQVGGILLLAHLGRLSASSAFWAIGFAGVVAGVAALIVSRNSYCIVTQRIIPDFLLSWSFGKWVVASSILWSMGMSVYPWLLAFFHGTAATAVWGACTGVVALASPALGGMQNYLGPRSATLYAQYGAEALRAFAVRASSAVLAILSLFWLFLLFAGERLAVLMYGRGYAGTGTLIAVLGLSLVAGAVAFTYSRVLFTVERADLEFRINVITLLLLLVVGIPMVRAWGALGAAAGLLISNVFAAGIRRLVTARVLAGKLAGGGPHWRRESGVEVG